MLKRFFIPLLLLVFGNSVRAQSWKNVSSGTDLPVHVLEADSSSNTLYAGGVFLNAGGVLSPGISQWNGNSWAPVGPAILSGTGISALCADSSKLYAGGTFSGIGGLLTSNIAVFDGTAWLPLDSGIGVAGVSTVNAICKYNGELYAAGTFVNAGFTPLSNIGKWNGSGWVSVGGGINGPVLSLEVYNGELYAGGTFTQAGSTPVKNIAKWDGTTWSDPGGGLEYTGATTVSTLRVYNNSLYAGGSFDTAGGIIPVKHIAAWDGTNWTDPGGGVDYTGATTVSTLRVYHGKLIVGGTFNLAGSTSANFVASWDQTSWLAMGAGMNNSVRSLAVVEDTLYAGGLFTMADNDTAMFVAQWSEPAPNTSTGIKSGSHENVSVFPNPANGILCVNAGSEKNFTLMLTDVCGRLVMQRNHCGGAVFVNVSALEAGVYSCNIRTEKGDIISAGKILIMR